ncbi:hypothetical protein T440DRAFT_402675 [Plenodomus tracheiphilus IPT5]|uniref:Zn(2)-C6 fungal-type domain-containing protein n=1 Tax=Plenodomus tracheiphilus IPT5 TaxID=1408161 RepID=A0A6A7AX19_9PLEO|nr:hypothetical protein T440DRAFT_402675 [Plenodomus tracheiphilus IPT5]
MNDHKESARTRQPPPQTVPVQQDFLFVDAAQAKTSRQGRRNARSFVMQKARRERPWSTSKHAARQRKSDSSDSTSPNIMGTPETSTSNTATPSPPIGFSRPGDFVPARLGTFASNINLVCSDCQILLCRPGQHLCPRCATLKPPAPAHRLDNRLFDPFQTSSVEITGGVSELLEHFVAEMAPGIIAVDVRNRSTLMRSDWFGTAMSHPGFMHSLLCTVALHLYISGRGTVEIILYHRAQAIAAINAAISSPNTHAGISDANIGAVFNLITVEESLQLPQFEQAQLQEDQPKQRAVHLSGLSRMLQLRGGLTAIKSNRILQAFIFWHSTAHAVFHFSAPDRSILDYISIANFPRHPPGFRPNISQHLINYCHHLGVAEKLTELMESVLVLIADLNVWYGDPESPLDPLDIQNFSCALECLLLDWLCEHESFVTPLEDALCVALLIFTIRTTEAMKLQSETHLLHFAASKRLQKALNCTIRSQWQSCPELLLWILSIGATSADGSTDSPWFVYQTSLACEAFDIHSAQALLERLHYCGWVSYKLNEAVYNLWERIVYVRLKPYVELPSKLEDADSPVGPLQHHVASPDLVEWESIGWAALSLGFDETEVTDTTTGEKGELCNPSLTDVNINRSDDVRTGYAYGCSYLWPLRVAG